MPTKANTKLVEFLISPENLPSTLEVMRHGDAVREVLLGRFWRRLHTHLKSQRPVEIEGADPVWATEFRQERMADKHVGIGLHPKSSKAQKQALFFQIESEVSQKHFDLYFGLHWMQPTKLKSSFLERREVQRVKKHQEDLDFVFDNNPLWHGWKYLKQYGNSDEFLLEFTDEPTPLLDAISGTFWQHVVETYRLVIEANERIR